MVAFVDEWLRRLEDMEPNPSAQRLPTKDSNGPSARPQPPLGVPKPVPDPPPDDRENKSDMPQRITSHNASRMDSYALATFADQQVSEAHREASKNAVGSMSVSRGFKTLRKFQGKVAVVMNSQISTTFWTVLILTNSVYLGVHVEVTAMNPEVSQIPVFFYIHLAFAAIFTLEVLCQVLFVSGRKAWNVGRTWKNLFTPLRVGGRPHRKFFGSVLVKICFKKLFAVFCDAL